MYRRPAIFKGSSARTVIARREDRLSAIAQAKAKIEQRAGERHQGEQQEYEAKSAKRKVQRDAGKKPRGKDPEAPQAGPKDADQVNLTDEESRIMPVSGGGFEQSYNAQAGVDTDTMMVITAHVTQACNDTRSRCAPRSVAIRSAQPVVGAVQRRVCSSSKRPHSRGFGTSGH